ncbi:putative bifunctional diguanylate cyclase/phosphodiesterase [Carnobacterium maltaromaticum]|uniref:putative bifunctional diguanylate cyclase/phosphodiesterase n=1 Tax=Carnobacterium maltaromaticum TaxID=2751 RepID=UPI0021525D2F|nr:EAL domain-containing protein [Carnobacterium maltaromaticum]
MKGIEKKEFLLHYQPKVHADTEELYGVEALIRWQVPWEDDLRYPDQFIPLAEQTGHIIQLSEQIIEMACHQIKVWLNLGFAIPVSLNLSANDFHGDALVCLVEKQLAKHQIPPNLLELEITETVLMADLTESQKNLKQLHEMGVQLSIDDFGTGYSSLRYVIDFPIQSLKIDRSFTEALNLDAKVTALTETIIQLADKLHLQVIVEGVETKEQLATLKTMGNFIIQGYYFSKPVSAKDVTDKWLKG